MNEPANGFPPEAGDPSVKKTILQLNPQYEEWINWPFHTWQSVLIRFYTTTAAWNDPKAVVAGIQLKKYLENHRATNRNDAGKSAVDNIKGMYPHLPGAN